MKHVQELGSTNSQGLGHAEATSSGIQLGTQRQAEDSTELGCKNGYSTQMC